MGSNSSTTMYKTSPGSWVEVAATATEGLKKVAHAVKFVENFINHSVEEECYT